MGVWFGGKGAIASSPIPEVINNNYPVIRTNSQPIRIPPPKVLEPKKDYELHLGKPETSNVRLVLRLSDRRVYVFDGDEEIASYPVAVGKAGWETPTGNFEVIQTVENPQWQNPWTGEIMPPGPDTALGLRWIGFWSDGENTIGFH
ncbi:MAG: L,D-transpeptidase, partial [Okeania sp. SIO2H7]|nr:L,D-transpeptidase [Okeania sp. SIO2H7]